MRPAEIVGRLASGDTVRVAWEGATVTTITRVDADPASLPIIAPGLVDLQVNGYGGFDVNAESVDADTVIELSRLMASNGVTTWLPTIITAPEQRILAALRAVTQAREADSVVAAAIPAVHVEGPFISDRPGARGVHNPEFVRPLDPEEIARWQQAAPVGIVTVSPHGPDAGSSPVSGRVSGSLWSAARRILSCWTAPMAWLTSCSRADGSQVLREPVAGGGRGSVEAGAGVGGEVAARHEHDLLGLGGGGERRRGEVAAGQAVVAGHDHQ